MTIRSGKAHSFGASALFGTQHIRTGQGFVWEDRFSRSPDYATHSPELANGFVWENGHWLRFVRGAGPLIPHWLALKIGGHTTAIMQSDPRPFSWDRATLRGHDDSFVESPSIRGIGTFRNSAHQNGPMGSFGKTDFREMSPDYATHSPEIANWVRLGERSLASFRTGSRAPVRFRAGRSWFRIVKEQETIAT